jgi:hypothetical protein
MVFVEQNPMVVLATGITTTTGMLSVLSYTTMSSTDMPAFFTVLLQA